MHAFVGEMRGYGTGVPGGMNRAVARIIGAYMEESSTTQEEVARRIGVSQSTVSRVLACTTAMTLDQFEALCGALHLDAVEVLSEATSR